jgi:uncharacterized peroxidase-related enzyme
MARITAIDPANATGKAKELLDGVQKKIGMTPNLMRTMAHSPAALEGYLSFSAALAGGVLSAKLREQIALTVGESNHCQYCVSAHTAIGKMVGLSEPDLIAARLSSSTDPKVDAALKFAHAIVERHGEVTDDEVNRIRQAGYTDAEIAEIVASVAINIFTNYFNRVAQTEVDFPKVDLGIKKAA